MAFNCDVVTIQPKTMKIKRLLMTAEFINFIYETN